MELLFYKFVFGLMAVASSVAYSENRIRYVNDGDKIEPDFDIVRKKYMKKNNQTWVLHAAGGGYWALVFTKLDIEGSPTCEYDYIYITELLSNSITSAELPRTKYCGNIVPQPYLSQSSHLEIHFITDNMWELEGFSITALHDLNKDILSRKVQEFNLQHGLTLIGLAENENGVHEDIAFGPVFYILIGSSSAALLLFGVLLTYFVISMRKHRLVDRQHIPATDCATNKQYNRLNFPSATVVLSNSKARQNTQELCKTGKKYTKK